MEPASAVIGSDNIYFIAKDYIMIRLAIISLVIAAVLAILGFGGAAGTFVGIAKILFFLAIALFVIFLVLGLLAGKGVKNAID